MYRITLKLKVLLKTNQNSNSLQHTLKSVGTRGDGASSTPITNLWSEDSLFLKSSSWRNQQQRMLSIPLWMAYPATIFFPQHCSDYPTKLKKLHVQNTRLSATRSKSAGETSHWLARLQSHRRGGEAAVWCPGETRLLICGPGLNFDSWSHY